MYEKVGIRELNQHLTKVLAQIERGDGRVVTKRDRPIAVLVPVEQAASVGLLEGDEGGDELARRHNLAKAKDLFARIRDLGHDVPEHAEALGVVYRRRRTSPARVGSWASSLTRASS